MKKKSKDWNVGVEAMRIMVEQNVTFRQAFDISTREKTALKKQEEKRRNG